MHVRVCLWVLVCTCLRGKHSRHFIIVEDLISISTNGKKTLLKSSYKQERQKYLLFSGRQSVENTHVGWFDHAGFESNSHNENQWSVIAEVEHGLNHKRHIDTLLPPEGSTDSLSRFQNRDSKLSLLLCNLYLRLTGLHKNSSTRVI